MHSHTACQLGQARIAYVFHPFFDRRVIVLCVMRRGETPSVIVRIEQNDGEDEELRINVPCWMLDEQACSRLVVDVKGDANSGRVAIDTLVRLRTLVDSGLMVVKGDCHESKTTTSKNAASEAAGI